VARPTGLGRYFSRNWIVPLALIGAYVAVGALPPDTSLSEVRKSGILRVCVPSRYPPLVTGDENAPGYDIQLVAAIASELGVRLSLSRNRSIGTDFNPRNWRVTRAQCQVIAGGVVASSLTRSFLDTTSPYLETGWAFVHRGDTIHLAGARVGFYSGLTGLNRIALSRYLRASDAAVRIVDTPEALFEGLHSGEFDVGVSEALVARQLARSEGWRVSWPDTELDRYPVALGLWKGDLTLKRAVERALRTIADRGTLADLAGRYAIGPIGNALVE
jgi:polar amino acid transport system substrate-binding protein/cystine transport system substrate-binding protein/membrane-bound lytic murein transglycosylase F